MAIVYPHTGFHFAVRFGEDMHLKYPGIADIGFQEVTGMNASVGVEEYQEGGENRFKHRLPNPVSYPDLVMKKGYISGMHLLRWFREEVESFRFHPYDITVMLLNPSHAPIRAWNFVNAWPIKWSTSGLNAQESSVLIEEVTFAYQYFTEREILDGSGVNI